jgi:asparagine synthase (glutamine-hydrolysing)
MPPRFIAFAAPGDLRRRNGRLAEVLGRAARDLGLVTVFDAAALIVIAAADTPILPIAGAGGVVVGHLFHRDDSALPVQTGEDLLGPAPAEALAAGLITRAWGGYVALLADRAGGRSHCLRDPSGVMPCFHVAWAGCDVFFSDIEPLLQLGLLRPSLDADFVAHYLAFRSLRTTRTGLKGVTEVLAGTRMTAGGTGAATDCLWTPWTFADRAAQWQDRPAAVKAVRAETQRCVQAWASTARSIQLELSGGLDSSIVAAGLAGHPAVACVTLVTPDPGADERRYAALAAAAIGAPLAAVPLTAGAADLRQPPRIASPRPGLGALQQVSDAAFLQAAAGRGIDAFFAGGGGDNVFCYLATAAPVVDAWLTLGPGPAARGALDDLSRMHGCTLWRAGWLAVKKRLRAPAPAWRRDIRFLRGDAVPATPDAHPWLVRPENALPGKIEHVANLLAIQTAPDGKDRAILAPVRHPLLSQPLVELCLQIPSWMWISGGINRALAREAFQDRLPPEVAARRSKGEFVGFSGAIYSANRQVIVDLLIGGWLDGAGILDRAAVTAYLDAPGPPRDQHYFRLLEIAGVETWARSWLSRAGEGGAEHYSCSPVLM